MPTIEVVVPLSIEEQQELIAEELGREDDTAFMLYLAKVWPLFDAYKKIDFRLPFLYVKRRSLQYLTGRYWTSRDWKNADQTQKDGQVFQNLHKMLDEVQDEIDVIVGRTRSRPPASGGLVAGQILVNRDGTPVGST